MRHPRTILRMRPVTLWGLGCSHEYVVGHRTGDSRLRGNDVGVWGCSGRHGGLVHLARSGFFLYALARVMQRSPFVGMT